MSYLDSIRKGLALDSIKTGISKFVSSINEFKSNHATLISEASKIYDSAKVISGLNSDEKKSDINNVNEGNENDTTRHSDEGIPNKQTMNDSKLSNTINTLTNNINTLTNNINTVSNTITSNVNTVSNTMTSNVNAIVNNVTSNINNTLDNTNNTLTNTRNTINEASNRFEGVLILCLIICCFGFIVFVGFISLINIVKSLFVSILIAFVVIKIVRNLIASPST